MSTTRFVCWFLGHKGQKEGGTIMFTCSRCGHFRRSRRWASLPDSHHLGQLGGWWRKRRKRPAVEAAAWMTDHLGQLEMWTGGLDDRATYWRLRLTERDMITMEREQLEMVQDGIWLIEQALKGRVKGPLTTPHGLPVRT